MQYNHMDSFPSYLGKNLVAKVPKDPVEFAGICPCFLVLELMFTISRMACQHDKEA